MTLEELWELFPIILSPHQPIWTDWAKAEISYLTDLLIPYSPIINHIGSTAIPSIQAKPTIDILVEIPPDYDWEIIKQIMHSAGYICMSQNIDRISFNKGYTPTGYAEKVFHIHFHRTEDNDEIFFRDYLIAHSDVAKQYETLKTRLLQK